jgi:hypothetical protein
MLAEVSVEYYTQVERGNVRGVSEAVLHSIADALQLDDVEREHLMDLARTANAASRPVRRRPSNERVRPGVQQVLDAMTDAAAFVRNGRLDILATNRLADALYRDVLADEVRPLNLARYVFLNPSAPSFYLDWDRIAADAVGSLLAEAGRDPFDRALTDLVGELSTRSEEFRFRWAAHNVRAYRNGVQPFHHTIVGDLTLSYEAFALPADTGQTMVVYTAEPQSPASNALQLLASWSATDQAVRVSKPVCPSDRTCDRGPDQG